MLRPHAEQIMRAVRPGDAQAVLVAGMELLRGDCAEVLFPLACNAARRFPADARIQQLFGLAARGSQRSRAAVEAFAAAARLAPGDGLIAHSHARAALEAGDPAVSLFDKARNLAAADGDVLLGRAAALLQDGRGEQAIADLTATVTANPLWLEGHRSLAHLRGQFGLSPDEPILDAIAGHPRSAPLHHLLVSIRLEARELEGAADALKAAAGALGSSAWQALMTAHVASERGDLPRATSMFDALPAPEVVNEASLHARHVIRCERAEQAVRLLDRWEDRDPANLLWPYRALAWRMTGDPRHAWLEGAAQLVGVYDLSDELGDLSALAGHLRALHFATSAPLDQSVRGGTQTDGNLLLRDEGPLNSLRKAIKGAVERHVAQLPAPDPLHPALLEHREPLRIAGSWSVNLSSQGHHSDHVHSQGWLSSAFYVALPETVAREPGGDTAGWLSLGEVRDLVPGLAPLRLVEPRPGRLVLFPSTMWHGTRPFPQGERLTVALDIAPPQQS